MRNTIKYNTTTEANSLKKGNFNIGINEVDYGPTSETGYHNTITPPANGYTIYKNIGDNKRSIYVAQNDQELVTIKNNFGATGNTAEEILNWASQQDDILILNKPLDDIVTDGLVLYLDAGVTPSYPRSGTTWTDLSGSGNTGTLINGVIYEDGSLVFDGVDDRVFTETPFGGLDEFTVTVWFKPTQSFTGTSNAVITTVWNSGDVNYYIGWGGYIGADGKIAAGIYKNKWIVAGSYVPTLNVWQSVSLSLSNQLLKMYFNGILLYQRSTSLIPNNIYGGIFIGKRWDLNGGNEYFKGDISTTKIYNRALTADEVLQNYNATKDRYAFITTWETTSSGETITLPLISTGTYDFTVEWGDDTTDTITSYNQSEVTHTYSEAGTYTVKIRGIIQGFQFNNGGDKHKIRSIDNYGPLVITTNSAFYGCTGLTSSAIDSPEISTTDLSNTFRDCTNFNGYVNNWDVSSVTNMTQMFRSALSFNQPIGNWDVSNVTDMSAMFYGVIGEQTSFNQPLNDWDVSSVTNMGYMFGLNTSFNQPLNNWDVSNVTSMSNMFGGRSNTRSVFNQDIGSWNVSGVTNMSQMFFWSSTFNNGGSDSINNWNTSSNTDMYYMFYVTPFNQPIGNWDVSNVTNMFSTFSFTPFNQDISNWDVSSVTDMGQMFWGASSFNQNIGNWNVSGVTNMNLMLSNADAFDQDISNWDIDQVTNFTDFMLNADGFSTTNYDALLVDWEAQVPQPNININFGTAKYTANSAAATARQSLIDNYNWTITDGGTI